MSYAESVHHLVDWKIPIIPFDPKYLAKAFYGRVNRLLQLESINPEFFLPRATSNRVRLKDSETRRELGIHEYLTWRVVLGDNGDLTAFGFTHKNKKQSLDRAIATIIVENQGKSLRTTGIKDGKIVSCRYEPNRQEQYELVHGMVSSPTMSVGMIAPQYPEQATWPYYPGLITKTMTLLNPSRLISTRKRDRGTFLCDQNDEGFTSHTHANHVFIADYNGFNFPLPRRIK